MLKPLWKPTQWVQQKGLWVNSSYNPRGATHPVILLHAWNWLLNSWVAFWEKKSLKHSNKSLFLELCTHSEFIPTTDGFTTVAWTVCLWNFKRLFLSMALCLCVKLHRSLFGAGLLFWVCDAFKPRLDYHSLISCGTLGVQKPTEGEKWIKAAGETCYFLGDTHQVCSPHVSRSCAVSRN